MNKEISAGILLYRFINGELQVFLAHNGGPFFVKKDDGYWTVPKGLIDEGESLVEAARREFKEEIGIEVNGEMLDLEEVTYKNGKIVIAFALEYSEDITKIKSNTVDIEWPPKSGKIQAFPEIDKGQFFDVATALTKINPQQADFIKRLQLKIS